MIIHVEGATAENVDAAKHSLESLAHSWGHEITETPIEAVTETPTIHSDDERAVDPVSVASLVVSIPSAALAVQDLADRIRKRRRARELINHAQQLAGRQTTIYLVSPCRTIDLRTLTPDRLLDLADEDPGQLS